MNSSASPPAEIRNLYENLYSIRNKKPEDVVERIAGLSALGVDEEDYIVGNINVIFRVVVDKNRAIDQGTRLSARTQQTYKDKEVARQSFAMSITGYLYNCLDKSFQHGTRGVVADVFLPEGQQYMEFADAGRN